MKPIRILTLLLALAILIALSAACGNDSAAAATEEPTLDTSEPTAQPETSFVTEEPVPEPGPAAEIVTEEEPAD